MTTLRKYEIGGMIAVVLLSALCLRGFLIQRDARSSADAFAQAQTAKTDDLNKQIDASKSEAAAYHAGMVEAAAAVTTPQQAVRIITRYLPGPNPAAISADAAGPAQPDIPVPIVRANELDADLSASLRAQLPPSPSYAILTEAQTEAIAKNDLTCDADRHSLAACIVQLADSKHISALDEAKATHYGQALKGGTILQRVGRVLKSTACAAGGAAVGALATRNTSTAAQTGSIAAGAAGGVIVCSIF